jgi:hypothetical protein
MGSFRRCIKKHDSAGHFNKERPWNCANNSAIAPRWRHGGEAQWRQFSVLMGGIVMFRAIAGCTALAVGLLLSLNLPATSACNGTGCPTAAGKPLNIMQFMREQAASTRVHETQPHHGKTQAKAKVTHRSHRTVAARPKPSLMPSPMPAEAAESFASRPQQQAPANVGVVTSDDANVPDRAAYGAPAETMGAAVAIGPAVQLVDAQEFNDIDRKADDSAPVLSSVAGGDAVQTDSNQANTSWLHWLWSALAGTFAALATAVRQLVHI